ncbi:Ribosomal lysine N-methyltransferase [Lachnellula occidentalis]|uniref:Ribosomal lysine N-methyltransferase n=1 Tax=Lachnellula occidentalis TaxID=215460 RepID=A0A8H8UDP9_9HELO|nr:Ribosomal lysine N-methyltransferase [Lachnellula occidentalis]
MSQSNPEIEGLLQWATSNHTSLHPSVEIFQDAITGLSFKAVQDVPSGTNFVSCSYQTTLSYLNVAEISSDFGCHGSQPFPSEFIDVLSSEDPNIIGHFFLIQQYLMGAASFWWNYIRLLPQPEQPEKLALPIWWPKADRKFLEGTNAEPPLVKRQELWKDEWNRGITILKQQSGHWEDYSYLLYQWAATIFGTRSFRASLTVPAELFEHTQTSQNNKDLILDHIRHDKFSVLLPVLDIGNHNGINAVAWTKDPEAGQFGLCTRDLIQQGSQIFNYYGDKSNSELLVGYGFTLPNLENDTVNLKLTPPTEAAQLRRTQISHASIYRSHPGEEFMFMVRRQSRVGRIDGSLVELDFFSAGLLDTMACMVANQRERQFIIENPDYSLEKDSAVFEGPLARNVLCILRVLSDKLYYDFRRIHGIGATLSKPQNSNQIMALDYRNRQLDVLKEALTPILKRLQSVASFSSLCQHPHHNQPPAHIEGYLHQMHTDIELLSLECAYSWMQINYPDIYDAVVKIISEDQEEPLPLDWAVLVEDWDHTYWVIWIYLVWVLWVEEDIAFQSRHPSLSTWLIEMNTYFVDQKTLGRPFSTFYADTSEQDTINHTIREITHLPRFDSIRLWLEAEEEPSSEALRNFASLVGREETVPARFNMQNVGDAAVEQKMLAISKRKAPLRVSLDEPWTRFFHKDAGFCPTSPSGCHPDGE